MLSRPKGSLVPSVGPMIEGLLHEPKSKVLAGVTGRVDPRYGSDIAMSSPWMSILVPMLRPGLDVSVDASEPVLDAISHDHPAKLEAFTIKLKSRIRKSSKVALVAERTIY